MSNTRIRTGKARLSYCHIWHPQKSDDGTEKYSVAVLIPKTDKTTIEAIKAGEKEAIAAGKAKFGDSWKPGPGKIALQDGDDKDDEVYAGHFYVNARNAKKPYIYDRNKNEVNDPAEVYSGCYAQVSFDIYPYQAKDANGKVISRGVTASLIAIRKVSDGENLGGGVTEQEALEMFDDLEDDDLL